MWKLNTSNTGKFKEFKHLFAQHGLELETTHFDLAEIDADPIQVVVHKASQLDERILVDDTSLEVEGASIGIHVKWLLDHLPEYRGRRARWTTLLAYHQGQEVFIYRGDVWGTLVEPRGQQGFGFDAVFMPEGTHQTLAEAKPNHLNARAKVVEDLVKGYVFKICPIIKRWEGPWQ